MVKYLQRLINCDSKSLLSNAFLESSSLHEDKKNSWISTIQLILKHLDIPFSSVYNKNFHHRVKSKLVSMYNLQFNKTLSDCREHEVGKLRTYALFKTNLCYEPYFDIIRNVDIRKCFTGFRVSSHRLQIELGRYKKVPKEKRLCELCLSGEVEDEIHFVTSCERYDNKRKAFYDTILSLNKHFGNLSKKDKFIWLFSNENKDVLLNLATFVYECYQLRGSVIKECQA